MSRLTVCSVTALVALIAGLSAPSIAVAQQATVAAINRGVVEIETSGAAGISVRIAEDLANLIDDGTTRRVVPVVGKGSLQSLTDLKYLRGVDMAILQTDVLDYAKEQRLLPGLESSLSYIPERGRLSRHAETAQAIDYSLKRWPALAARHIAVRSFRSGSAVRRPDRCCCARYSRWPIHHSLSRTLDRCRGPTSVQTASR